MNTIDLTQRPPRSPRLTLAGYVILPRKENADCGMRNADCGIGGQRRDFAVRPLATNIASSFLNFSLRSRKCGIRGRKSGTRSAECEMGGQLPDFAVRPLAMQTARNCLASRHGSSTAVNT